jgi:Chaperone of endosialidase
MNPPTQLKRATLVFLAVLVCFALPPTLRAAEPCANCSGRGNTSLGITALENQTGNTSSDTAIGFAAMQSTTNGQRNTAVGVSALEQNVTGNDNTAIGYQALSRNQSNLNTATGKEALRSNTTGDSNVANGAGALARNSTGSDNTAIGFEALVNNTSGRANVAIGSGALANSTGGVGNTALGVNAGQNLRSGGSNLDIDNDGEARDQGTIRIGDNRVHTRTFIAGISGVGVTGAAVLVKDDGQLGTAPSSQRFKDEIEPMDKASEAILALKPVTFRYKKDLDPDKIPQFGLIAEEVAKVNPDLVVRDKNGKPYSVRYDQVNAMLLNEFLKEHQKVQRLEAALAAMNEQLKAQDAKIDKVNAKVEASKPASPMVVNN